MTHRPTTKHASALLVAGCCLAASATTATAQQEPQRVAVAAAAAAAEAYGRGRRSSAATGTTTAGFPVGGLRNLEIIRRKRVLDKNMAASSVREQNQQQQQQQPLQAQRQGTGAAADLDDYEAFFESNWFDLRHLEEASLTAEPTKESGSTPEPSLEATPPPTPVDCNADPERREELIRELLEGTSDDIDDPSTPAGQAADFIINGDPAMVDPCKDPTAVVNRFALSAVYYSTGGEQWRNNDGWLGEDDACDWFGIVCDGDNIVELNLGTSIFCILC